MAEPGDQLEGRDRADAAPGTTTTARRIAVIVNPTKNGVDELRRLVASAESTHGLEPSTWYETTEEDPGTGMARQAHADGADLVLAAGGDGTIRAVAEGVRSEGIPLGLIPLGTGNLFARNLGIPVNAIEESVAIAFSGTEREIDVLAADVRRPDGSLEHHVSLVMSGVGIDAAMIANTNPDLKERVGWLAYVDAGLRALPVSIPFRVSYRLDAGRTRRASVASVLVANLGYLPGNIELIPHAEVDDGRLDVVRLQPRNFWGWLMIWRKIAWENRVLRKTAIGRQLIDLTGGDRRREVVYSKGRTVEVRIDGDPQEFEIDGEELGQVVAVRFTVDPGALTVRVPE